MNEVTIERTLRLLQSISAILALVTRRRGGAII